MSTGGTGALLTIYFLGLIPVCFLIYAIPSIIAFRRRHPNRFVILVINIALGSTGIGWLGALIWALGAVHLSNQAGGSHGGESGLNLFANDPKVVRRIGSGRSSAGENEAVAAPTVAEVVDAIERLGLLSTTGHLSTAEFADLKANALRRMRIAGSHNQLPSHRPE